jgi:hypothetical protein
MSILRRWQIHAAHRRAIPLPMVDLDAELEKERRKKARPLFDLMECGEGMCGIQFRPILFFTEVYS